MFHKFKKLEILSLYMQAIYFAETSHFVKEIENFKELLHYKKLCHNFEFWFAVRGQWYFNKCIQNFLAFVFAKWYLTKNGKERVFK